MKTILALGASSSTQSINRQLALYTASQVTDATVVDLDLNNFEMPIFSIDREAADGHPQLAHDFLKRIQDCDGVVISMAEHNGAYSAAFKNIYDWMSRINDKPWSDKPMFLLSTSPGGRGGQTVHEIAAAKFPRMGANVVASFMLPSFYENFSAEEGILNEELSTAFEEQLTLFQAAI